MKEVAEGTLAEDFDPPFEAPQEIPDPQEEKPKDWVDEAMQVAPFDF